MSELPFFRAGESAGRRNGLWLALAFGLVMILSGVVAITMALLAGMPGTQAAAGMQPAGPSFEFIYVGGKGTSKGYWPK